MFSGLMTFTVPYLICAVLIGPLTGWLAGLRGAPFRFFARHPWLVAWGGSFLVAASVVVFVTGLGATVTSPAIMPVYLSLLVTTAAAVQGLRVTWSRSKLRGALVLLGFLVFTFIETVSIPRNAADFYSHSFAAISLAPSWGFAAWLAHVVGQRHAPQMQPSRRS